MGQMKITISVPAPFLPYPGSKRGAKSLSSSGVSPCMVNPLSWFWRLEIQQGDPNDPRADVESMIYHDMLWLPNAVGKPPQGFQGPGQRRPRWKSKTRWRWRLRPSPQRLLWNFFLSLSLAINLPFWSYLILSDPSVYVYLTSILTNNLTN